MESLSQQQQRGYSLPSPTSPSSTSSSTASITKKRSSKSHVPTACVNCKKAHLACDLSRPCKRCVSMGKTDSCYDIQHKKRGRPKLRDKRTSTSTWKHDKSEKHRPINHSNSSSASASNHGTAVATAAATMAMTVAPAIAPGIANSSFTMTQPPGYQEPKESVNSMMTIFLSMDMRCARASDEALEFLGLYPQQLAHRSLYDFLVSTDGLENIHRCLLDSNRPASQITTTSEQFVSIPPSQLLSIANGSQTFKETLHFKQPNGTFFDPLQARFYLGGGLGADLFMPITLDRLYIVCLLTIKPQSSNNNAVALPNDATATVRPITPKHQQEQLLPHDDLNTVALADPQQAFQWTPTTSSPSMDNTDAFRLYDANLSSSNNSTTTATTTSTAITERWGSDDETHQLVWMHPHDFVYAPQIQQQTKPSSIDHTKIPITTATTTTTTTTPTNILDNNNHHHAIPPSSESSWHVGQSDMGSLLVPTTPATTTDYEAMMMRDMK
ncbi:hypothetical protein BDB00DRAFT_788493 [Zychaea mexicana]|uniref:uncharacterized protein n=1 Tax=Zychaea mexicana TaxID=64656 RepID=UPI0022FDEAB6|nr:uncharacterized protein BDB00DRAFT_788493 [Zychaea mexicana]KAI9492850.1 hypothetical protein BDB00DRAFT_788493 [Zychaea mexicana]